MAAARYARSELEPIRPRRPDDHRRAAPGSRSPVAPRIRSSREPPRRPLSAAVVAPPATAVDPDPDRRSLADPNLRRPSHRAGRCRPRPSTPPSAESPAPAMNGPRSRPADLPASAAGGEPPAAEVAAAEPPANRTSSSSIAAAPAEPRAGSAPVLAAAARRRRREGQPLDRVVPRRRRGAAPDAPEPGRRPSRRARVPPRGGGRSDADGRPVAVVLVAVAPPPRTASAGTVAYPSTGPAEAALAMVERTLRGAARGTDG